MIDSKNKLFAQERKGQIYSLIKENERMTVIDLANEFQVTPTTVRSDLQELEDMHLIIRTHGGAMIRPEKNIKEFSPMEKETLYLQEKQSIAKTALKYIEDGDIIVLDTGTTTLELAKLLHVKKELTVITNDLQIGLILNGSTSIQTFFLGGSIRHQFHYTNDSSAIESLSSFTANKSFIGCNAVDFDFGLSTSDVHLAAVKHKMMQISEQSILLSDSSKLGKKALKSFSSIMDIDTFITDNRISDKMFESLVELGVNIIRAETV